MNVLITTLIFTISANLGAQMNNFTCFKDFPNTTNPKIKEVDVTEKLPEWNLGYLYSGLKDEKIFSDLEQAVKESNNFKKKYKFSLSKEMLSATELKKAIQEYEKIIQKAWLPQGYLSNMHNVDLSDSELTSLMGKADILGSTINKNLSFFENSLSRVSNQYKSNVLNAKELWEYKNFLSKVSDKKKHILPDDQEELIIDKDVNGVDAWAKFRSVFESKYIFPFKGPEDKKVRDYTLTELTALVENPDRDIRQAAAGTFLKQFNKDSYVYAQIYNSIIQDMIAIGKNRRGFPTLIAARNLSSQLDDKLVETMHKVITENFNVAQRYWKLKAQILGIKDFNNADVMAPYIAKGREREKYTYPEAMKLVQETLDDFYKPFGAAFENMYRCGLVHATIKKGKRGGAYCDSFGVKNSPIILVNFQGTIEDVSTIAHEGGHWLHFLLISEKQPLVNADVPMATAETASVFNEVLLTSKMIKESQTDKKALLGFLMDKLDRIFATVARQTAFSNFEQAVFKQSENGPLTPEEFSKIFTDEYKKLFGDAVKMTPDFNYEWARIPHFMRPFYVYAYAFGELATISLYQKYLDSPGTFPEKYMNQFLAAGGSRKPVDLFKTVDVDLNDENTWQDGFKYISSLIDKVEELYKD
ncbi:MAG: M3 family metallopeptidase [Pseudomonadota bacterium]